MHDARADELPDEGTIIEPVIEPNGSANEDTFNESDECSNKFCAYTFTDRESDGGTNQSPLQRSSRPRSQLSDIVRLFRRK